MERVIRRRAGVARVGPVVFQDGQAGVLHEALQLSQVVVSPLRSQARRYAEARSCPTVLSAGVPAGRLEQSE